MICADENRHGDPTIAVRARQAVAEPGLRRDRVLLEVDDWNRERRRHEAWAVEVRLASAAGGPATTARAAPARSPAAPARSAAASARGAAAPGRAAPARRPAAAGGAAATRGATAGAGI